MSLYFTMIGGRTTIKRYSLIDWFKTWLTFVDFCQGKESHFCYKRTWRWKLCVLGWKRRVSALYKSTKVIANWIAPYRYFSLLNTDTKRELDHLAAFLKMAVDWKKKIGFNGQLLIEPKPREPTKHQYDYGNLNIFLLVNKSQAILNASL